MARLYRVGTGQFSNDANRWAPLGPTWADGWPSNDHLFTNVSEYASDLVTHLNTTILNNRQTKLLWQRPKIEWLAYGQSSTYEAEPISTSDPQWFYSFQVSNGEPQKDDQWGNGHWVLHCCEPANGPNAEVVLKRLKANTEQCRGSLASNTDGFQTDNHCRWFIKPKLRIPADYPQSHEQSPVCSIKVVAQDGSTLKEVILRGINFLDENYNYDGRYIEEYLHLPLSDSLAVQNAWLGNASVGKWWCDARGNGPDGANHADIWVYWYGYCDMWIDYVKVENDIANDLLSTNPNNIQHLLYDQWIDSEVTQIAFANGPGSEPVIQKFYMELCEFNNLPCMAYVNQKLKYYSQQHSGNRYTVDLMADFVAAFMFYHLRFPEHFDRVGTPGWIYRNYIQKVGFTQFFAESYPLTSTYDWPATQTTTWSRIPNTLPNLPRCWCCHQQQNSPITKLKHLV